MSAIALNGALARESRLRPRAAVIAVVAGVLLLASGVVLLLGPQPKVDEATLVLIVDNKRAALGILYGVISALGSLAIGLTLLFLLGSAQARNPRISPAIRVIVIVAAVLAAITNLGNAIVTVQKAHQFVTTGSQTYQEAHQLTTSSGLLILEIGGLLGLLLTVVSLILVSMHAMRVGLLTRFMGYLGFISAALLVIQLTPVPIIETYWFIALAVLFAGRWPSGEPAAWSSEEAVPLPSAQEMRERRVRAAGGAGAGGTRAARGRAAGRNQPGAAKGRPAAATASTDGQNGADSGGVAAGGTPARSASAKRKRKRRR